MVVLGKGGQTTSRVACGSKPKKVGTVDESKGTRLILGLKTFRGNDQSPCVYERNGRELCDGETRVGSVEELSLCGYAKGVRSMRVVNVKRMVKISVHTNDILKTRVLSVEELSLCLYKRDQKYDGRKC